MTRGLAYMVAAVFFFSVMGALVKLAGQRLPSEELVFARSFLGLVLSWWMLKRARLSWRGVNRPLLLARALFGFGGLLCFFYALTAMPLGDAVVIMNTSPIWTAVLAVLVLKERVTPALAFALALALVGVVLIARPPFLFDGASAPLWPTIIALIGAVSAGAAYVSVRALRKTDEALVIVFWFPLIATPLTIPMMADNLVMPEGLEWLMLAGLGITVQIAQVFMTKGLHLETASRGTAITSVGVVFAFTWGVLFFDEQPTSTSLIGAALIIAGAMTVASSREA